MNAKLEAYLQIARLSNVPTVFSNVLVGMTLASSATSIPIDITLLAMLALSLFYVGGMAQNDLFDLKIDAKENAQRPLPSGALSVREVRVFIATTFGLGFFLIAATAPKALYYTLALLICITLYNLFHKKWTASLVFMGLCRAFVYCVAAAMIVYRQQQDLSWTPLAYFAALLAVYIIAITLVAQKEAAGALGYRRWLALCIIAFPFFAHFATPYTFTPVLCISGIVLALWLLRSARFVWNTPPKVVPAILGWLSGICLIDAYFLALLNRPGLASIAGLCFITTVLGHRRILGT
jgi:4-hydroxybenzoate polyprenyltransferase